MMEEKLGGGVDSEIDAEENTPLLNPTSQQQQQQEEITPSISTTSSSTTIESQKSAQSPQSRRSVRTKVPEVELHVYRQGKGPIAVYNSTLGGWDQNQLEVHDILEKHGFKSIYAFNHNDKDGVRTVPIRFHPRNGRSILPYKDGSVIYIDGEPKDSLIKPITRIVVGVAIITILIAVVVTESPMWAEKLNLKGMRIPPWVLTCAVILFTRMRKRTKDFFKNRGWCQ